MDNQKMMGLKTPGDQKVSVPVRDWNAMKLALWRSRTGWEITARSALEALGRCKHLEGCPGVGDDDEPCLAGCEDRETRMSLLVILGAARMFAPFDARRPAAESFLAPSREYFSEVMGELSAGQIENDALRAALTAAGIEIPAPAPDVKPLPESPQQPRFALTPLEETTT